MTHMKKKYMEPKMKALFIGNENLMDASMQLNNSEAGDDWQGAKGQTFLDDDDATTSITKGGSLWDE